MSTTPIKKTLIIFDFDSTITNADSFQSTTAVLNDPQMSQNILDRARTENWIELFNWFYVYLKSKNIPLTAIDDEMRKLPLSPGMHELFAYLRDNKASKHFDVIILSAGHSYGLNFILTHNNIIDVFDHILCTPARVDDEGKVVAVQRYTHSCSICNPAQCKSKEYNDFMKGKEDTYKKVCYVCDGGNDICLAQILKENDCVLPRKEFKFYKKIYGEEKLIEKIKGKIVPWESGKEIIEYLESL